MQKKQHDVNHENKISLFSSQQEIKVSHQSTHNKIMNVKTRNKSISLVKTQEDYS
jgi:hypothetical protein